MSSRNASSSRSSSRSSRHNDSRKREVKSMKEESDDDTENEAVDLDSDSSSGAKRKKKSKHREKDNAEKSEKKKYLLKVKVSPDIGQLINRILCTACGKQLNHTNPGAVREHPWLKVVTCKKCYKFLRSGPFTRDNDGIDEQCRWCGDGGRIYGCDFCHNCFCRSCIKRNLGRSEAAKFENDEDSKWHCYICKPKKIHKLRDDCEQILAYIEQEEEKEKEKERRAKLREEKKKKLKEEKENSISRDHSQEREDSKDGDKDRNKEREGSLDKSIKVRTLPAPKPKTAPVVVIDESPQKKHEESVKPSVEAKQIIKLELKNVQNFGNAVKQVVVHPRPPQPVTFPYKHLATGNAGATGRNTPTILNQRRPVLEGMLQSNSINGTNNLPPNNLTALMNAIFPNNVEMCVEKLMPLYQSFSLLLNSIKTDLAIAKLSQSNMFVAKNSASHSLRNGMTEFFKKMRELFKLQISVDAGVIEIDGGSDDVMASKASTDVSSRSSTPVRPSSSTVVKDDPDVSLIPISLDDSDVGEQKDIAKEQDNKSKTKIEEVNGKEPLIVSDDDDDDVQDDKEMKENIIDDKESVVDKADIKVEIKSENKPDEILELDNDSEEGDIKEVISEVNDVNKQVDSSDKAENLSEDDEGKKTAENIEEEDDIGDNEIEKPEPMEDDNESDNEVVSSLNGAMDQSENTAAELELLKEMADEINEKSAQEMEEPRRSGRQKQEKGKIEDEEDEEEDDDEKKVRKLRKHSPQKKHGKSKENDKDEEEEETGRKSRKQSSKHEKSSDKGDDEEKEEEEENIRRSSRQSSKKHEKHQKSNDEIDHEEEDDEGDVENDKKSSKQLASKKQNKHGKSKDKADEEENVKKEEDDSDHSEKKHHHHKAKETKDESEVGNEGDEKSTKKDHSKHKHSKKTDDKDDVKEDDDEDSSPVRRSSRQKPKDEPKEETSKGKEKDSKKSKKGKHDGDESVDKDQDDVKDKSKQKKKKHKDDKKDNSDENDDNSSPERKDLKLKVKIVFNKDNKSKSTDKSEKVSCSLNDETSGSESDDSDSDESPDEFGKRKKKRKTRQTKAKDEKPDNVKTEKIEKDKKKTKKEKASSQEEEELHSDSSNFDPELEKEIQSLAKETRLTRRAKKEAKDEPESGKENKKSEKTEKMEKSKKVTVKTKVESEDLSSDDEPMLPDSHDEDEDGMEEDEDEGDTDDLSPSQLQKLKKASKEAEEDGSDYELMHADSDDTSDPEVSFPKARSPKKGASKKKGTILLESDDESDDSEYLSSKKKKGKKQRVKDALLDADLSDSGSEKDKKRKKGKGRKRKKNGSDSEPDVYDEVYSDDNKKKGKGKRKRIKKVSSSEEEAAKEPGESDEMTGSDDGLGGYHKRKKIRKVMANKKLGDETKQARKMEEERRKRIEERQKEYNSYVEIEGAEEEEELPEGTERVLTTEEGTDTISKILGSPRKVPVTTRCILELDKDKKPLIEIDKTLVKKLKPHQVEAVRFIFNCLVENVSRVKKEEGAGCILAHCMGLGKTLSVITFVHTMLSNHKLTNMKHALVVCPLNTTLNWVNEFEIWLDDVDFEIDVYELSRVKQNFERAQMLKEWIEGGAGVMIINYDMYRNLVNGSHCKNKKQKKTFFEALAEPGPDLVICDEGHILKNDQTALAKAMMKVKTRRRVVLTGTPLQNNLIEYHCMANFVKPNLLGTRKEFSNRFANPITNGQCSDSTPQDVKLMKRRAHILHEMLAGCVQRKDYSALTKYLPPKLEYVISVRLGKVQMSLYEKYLELAGIRAPSGGDPNAQSLKGARLFRDYQALMRIWTHPWVMKLDEIRQENKKMYDESEDSFVDDESEEDSFVDSSTTSESDSDSKSKNKKKSKGKSKKGRTGSSSGSNTEEEKKDDKNEVVKKWTSRRRGNEEGAGSSWMEDWGYGSEVGPPKGVTSEWWAEYVKEEDETKLELSGKVILLFEVLRMCEDIGDKVLVFSQSLLSLDIIEDFLAKVDEDFTSKTSSEGQGDGTKVDDKKEVKKDKDGKEEEEEVVNGEKKEGEGTEDSKKGKYPEYGQTWVKGADYFRMDGSTNSVQRKTSQDLFNDPENYRARLFLISTKAGSLGINLVSANRVIIFDASWNPSHDIQSIFRVYRFGQTKPVYVYRFLAQGTMEEKIYERQVTKQSLSQRVVDEHQIERHFSNADLSELYNFTPDRLDDPNKKETPLPMLPKDHMLAELMTSKKEWIVTFHEHDSLLENKPEQDLTEDEKKAAWEDYENEKKGMGRPMYGGMYGNAAMYQNPNMDLASLVAQGQANLGQAAVAQIITDLKTRFPNLPPQLFQQRVEAVMRAVLTQQIMRQSQIQQQQVHFQQQQIDQQKANELYRLNQLKQQIQRQQAMISNQQRGMTIGGYGAGNMIGMPNVSSHSMFMGASGASGGSYMAGQMGGQMTSLLSSQMAQNYQNKSGSSSGGQGGGGGTGGGSSKS